jgi:hypothetical protein
MGVVIPTGYVKPYGDRSLMCARILHAGAWLAGGTAAASTTAAGYFADGPLNSLTYERWKPAAAPATYEYDHGTAAQCDCAGVAAHTLGTAGATVALQYYDATWKTVATVTPVDDMPILFLFAPVTAQRWRLSITGAAAEVGVFKLGMAMQMPQTVDPGHQPLNLSRQVQLRTNRSDTGETLGRSIQRTMLGTSYQWRNLEDQWIRDVWRSFQTAIAAEPFFMAWQPEVWSEVALCSVDELPVPVETGERTRSRVLQVSDVTDPRVRALFSVEMKVRSHAWD